MTVEKNKTKKYITGFWILFLTGILAVFMLFFLIAKGKLGFMPSFEELENPKSALATEIYTTDGKILDKYFLHENRTFIDYNNLPQHLIDALIATEDVRFYRHAGIDLRGLGRVVKGIVTGNTSSGGGSTISQQLDRKSVV